jgi:lipopolysaccharide cholinephosphotransferase
MRQLSLEEMKKIELEMIEDIHNFCEENDIDYFLCGGSLLGAVRHKGFIPWDDDIDIGMTRENYDKFLKLYRSEKYNVRHASLDEPYYFPYIKICDKRTVLHTITDFGCEMGVWVDIFPMDNVPENMKKTKKHVSRMTWKRFFVIAMTAVDIHNRKFSSRVFIHLVRIYMKLFRVKKEKVMQKYEAAATKYRDIETSKMGCVVWGYGMGEICDREVFEKTTTAPFEHLNVRILENYHPYLHGIYGDYMQLPPEEKRVLKHDDSKLYLKDGCEI